VIPERETASSTIVAIGRPLVGCGADECMYVLAAASLLSGESLPRAVRGTAPPGPGDTQPDHGPGRSVLACRVVPALAWTPPIGPGD
jgi:hypothetical protein